MTVSPKHMKEVLQEKVTLDSRMLHSVTYHFKEKRLEVQYRKGKVRSYLPVTEGQYRELLEAKSPGKELMKLLKDNPEIRKIDPHKPKKKSWWARLLGWK